MRENFAGEVAVYNVLDSGNYKVIHQRADSSHTLVAVGKEDTVTHSQADEVELVECYGKCFVP